MKKHSGMTLKIFICFLLMATVTFLLFKFIGLRNESALEDATQKARQLTDIKVDNFKNGLFGIEASISPILNEKVIFDSAGNLSEYYFKIAYGFSDDIVSALQKELKGIYTNLYGVKATEYLLPHSETDIIAQSAAMRGKLGDRELFNALVQNDNVKKYIVEEKSLEDFFDKNLLKTGIDDLLIVSPSGYIVYVYSKKAALGDNAYSGNVGGFGAARQPDNSSDSVLYISEMNFADNTTPVAYIAKTLPGGGLAVATVGNDKLGASLSSNSSANQEVSFFLSDKKGQYISSFGNNDKAPLPLSEIDLLQYIDANADKGNKLVETPTGFYIFSFKSVNVAGTDWIVSSIVPYEQAKISLIIFYALTVISILLLSWLLALWIMRPVTKLRNVFIRCAEGNINTRVSVESGDELRDFANAFNSMTDRLSAEIENNLANKLVLQNEINERKAIEAKLFSEHHFVNSILNSSGVSLIVLDENNKIIRINESLLKIFDEKYIIGKDVFTALPETYKEEILLACEKVRNNNENVLVHTVSHRATHDIHLEWTLSRLDTPDENIKYISAIGFNVTEKYIAKANLKENEEILQIIMSHAQDAIIVTNGKENISIANEAAKKMLGYTGSDMQGKPMVPFVIPEEYRDEFLDDVASGVTLEMYAVNKNGERFPIELSISKVKVMSRWNTLYIIRDASLRKKRENDMFKALDKAKTAEKAKSEFLANMSHEIRTPLNGIIGFLNLLRQTPLDKTQLDYLNIINSSSDSLLSIINDILDFSKIESGKMTLETLEFNSTEVVEQVTELYAAKANEKGINLIVISDPKVPEWLVGDQLRLKQIISNLLSNAIKFTDTGGSITVKIAIESMDEKNCILRISVKDTGIGINKEKQGLIFEAFSQADSSVTRKYGGSGLGLAICVRIAKLMGDSGLQINSEEGKGSEFYFNASFEIGINESKEKPVFKDIKVGLYDCSDNACLFRSACKEYMEILQCTIIVFETFEELIAIGEIDVLCMGYRSVDAELVKTINDTMPDKPKIYLTCDRNVGNLKHLESNTVRTLSQPLNISKFLDAFTFLIRKNTTITQDAVAVKKRDSVFSGHVLVVEDNAVNRRLADIMLKQFGLTVELAINGKEALTMFIGNKYDLIFMDIHMPILDGVSATKEIIRLERISGATHTPIIALTANVIPKDRESYIEAGMDAFLAKPIEHNKLEAVLSQFLDSDKAKTIFRNLADAFEINDQETIRNIVDEFLKVASRQIGEMREALKHKDMKKLIANAISMKGAAMNLRFDAIILAAKRIETSVTEEKDTDYGNIVDDLETELLRIKRVIG